MPLITWPGLIPLAHAERAAPPSAVIPTSAQPTPRAEAAEAWHEDLLHLGALARIAAATGPAAAAAVSEATALLMVGQAAPLQERLLASLLALAQQNAALRARVFSEAVVRLFAATEDADARLSGEPPVDDLVAAILSGGDADALADERAAPFREYADRHAFLLGVLLSQRPGWWTDVWSELLGHRGGEAFGPLPALLAGVAAGLHGAAPAGPEDQPNTPEERAALRAGLVALCCSGRLLVRRAAVEALARLLAQGADNDAGEREARACLQVALRDPEAAVRTALAAALPPWAPWAAPLLTHLSTDVSAAVRLAATWRLVMGSLGAPPGAALLTACELDLRLGSPPVRAAAAAAAAALGALDAVVGESLRASLLSDSQPEGEAPSDAAWEGLERYQTAAWPLRLWAEAPDNAAQLRAAAIGNRGAEAALATGNRGAEAALSADGNGWLLALGAALRAGLTGLAEAPQEDREALRARALANLTAEEEPLRLAAAQTLAALLPETPALARQLLAMLLDAGAQGPGASPEPLALPLLRVIALLAPAVDPAAAPAPRLDLAPLCACLSEPLPPGDEAQAEAATLALLCLGELATPADGPVVALLRQTLQGSRGPLAGAAYLALARLTTRPAPQPAQPPTETPLPTETPPPPAQPPAAAPPPAQPPAQAGEPTTAAGDPPP